jgi:hypothetical protein
MHDVSSALPTAHGWVMHTLLTLCIHYVSDVDTEKPVVLIPRVELIA